MVRQVEWVKPPLLWQDKPFGTSTQQAPELLELQGDNFLPDFVEAMQTVTRRIKGGDPLEVPRLFLETKRKARSDTLKLYQPFHDRYYLVTGSLVCRTAGVPDKTVVRKRGETVSFVLRRVEIQNDAIVKEEAWSEKTGWTEPPPEALGKHEEQHALQPISICDGRIDRTTGQPCTRTLFYGLIPAGNREKYANRVQVALPGLDDDDDSLTDSQRLKKYYAEIEKQSTNALDYRLEDFDTRVLAPWNDLVDDATRTNSAQRIEATRTIFIDLGDFLARALPDVWQALKNGDSLSGDQDTLLDLLRNTRSFTNLSTTFADVLASIADFIDDNGARDYENPPSLGIGANYLFNLRQPHPTISGAFISLNSQQFPNGPRDPAGEGLLSQRVSAALDEVNAPMQYAVGDDEAEAEAKSMVEMIRRFVVPTRVNASGQRRAEARYIVRMVYVYDPQCPPILSEPSPHFALAKPFDPDAPARTVRVEMPSIRPADLRKYAKGVGIQMSNDLRKVINDVHPGMLKGDAPNDTASLSLDMICTFSIPIITLVAFIVMFIFLILFNIIFWWLAFIRICLPIPKVDS